MNALDISMPPMGPTPASLRSAPMEKLRALDKLPEGLDAWVDRVQGWLQRRPHQARQHPIAGRGLDRDKRRLCRQHHAEHQQDERATDVDHQLHRPHELGASQKEEAGRRGEREHEIKGHADDVVGQHHGHRTRARNGGKEQEQDRMPVDGSHGPRTNQCGKHARHRHGGGEQDGHHDPTCTTAGDSTVDC